MNCAKSYLLMLKSALFLMIIPVLFIFNIPENVNAQDTPVAKAVKKAVAEAVKQSDSITAGELSEAISKGEKIVLIDIRTEAEYKAGHIKGAKWSPRGKLEFAAERNKLPPVDSEIVIYCKKHGRSSLSAVMLKNLGYKNVRFLKDGFFGWVKSGRTIYNIHGELTVVNFEKKEK